MRHSSGWSTLISISFFMRSVFLSHAADRPGTGPRRPAGSVVSGWGFGHAGRGRWTRGHRAGGQLDVRPSQDGPRFQQVVQAEGVDHVLGPGRAAGQDLEVEVERTVAG